MYYITDIIIDIKINKEEGNIMIKRSTISVRIDNRTKKRIELLAEDTNVSKGEVIRQAIKMMSEAYNLDEAREVLSNDVG